MMCGARPGTSYSTLLLDMCADYGLAIANTILRMRCIIIEHGTILPQCICINEYTLQLDLALK